EKKLQQEEKRINNLADQLFRKEELFIEQLTAISQKEKKIQEETEKVKKMEEEIVDKLGTLIPMSREEAKKNLFTLLQAEVDQNLERYKEQKFKHLKEQLKGEGTKMICLALEKY